MLTRKTGSPIYGLSPFVRGGRWGRDCVVGPANPVHWPTFPEADTDFMRRNRLESAHFEEVRSFWFVLDYQR